MPKSPITTPTKPKSLHHLDNTYTPPSYTPPSIPLSTLVSQALTPHNVSSPTSPDNSVTSAFASLACRPVGIHRPLYSPPTSLSSNRVRKCYSDRGVDRRCERDVEAGCGDTATTARRGLIERFTALKLCM